MTPVRAPFLSSVGARTYTLLRSLLHPDKPGEKPFADICATSEVHFHPKPSTTMQRFKFNSRSRQPGESVANYVAKLRRLAEYCEFGDSLSDLLRDRLVVGVQDERIQRRLLSERDLKFQKAYEVAQAMEFAAKNAEQLSASANGDVKPETPPVVVQNVNSQKPTLSSCYRCDCKGHVPSSRRFKSATCHGCKKMGHILRACKAKGKGGKQEQRAAVVEQEWELPEDDEQSQQYHHYMTHKVSKEKIVNSLESNQKPWVTPVMIEGKILTWKLTLVHQCHRSVKLFIGSCGKSSALHCVIQPLS